MPAVGQIFAGHYIPLLSLSWKEFLRSEDIQTVRGEKKILIWKEMHLKTLIYYLNQNF